MYGLVTGDFNRSFIPGAKKAASATLDLVYGNEQQISNNQEFDLPIRLVNASEVGAVSLILNFPAEFVEIMDVTMPDAGGMLDWAVKGNELRIGWNSSNPISLNDNANLLVLKLKTTNDFILGNSIRFTLAGDPLNELADAKYDVIAHAVLSIDVVNAVAVGISDPGTEEVMLSLSAFPNPFSQSTTIAYTLPFDGEVTIMINSMVGTSVIKLVSEPQTQGNHTVKFNTEGMESGVFTATLMLKSKDDQMYKTIKLINNK